MRIDIVDPYGTTTIGTGNLADTIRQGSYDKLFDGATHVVVSWLDRRETAGEFKSFVDLVKTAMWGEMQAQIEAIDAAALRAPEPDYWDFNV